MSIFSMKLKKDEEFSLIYGEFPGVAVSAVIKNLGPGTIENADYKQGPKIERNQTRVWAAVHYIESDDKSVRGRLTIRSTRAESAIEVEFLQSAGKG